MSEYRKSLLAVSKHRRFAFFVSLAAAPFVAAFLLGAPWWIAYFSVPVVVYAGGRA